MSDVDNIQALFQTGKQENITLALMFIEGGAASPLEVYPNLYEVYNFLRKYNQVKEASTDIEKIKHLVNLERLFLDNNNLTGQYTHPTATVYQ